MKTIQYVPEAIRRVAGECRTEAESVDISRQEMMYKMKANTGPMREMVEKNIISAQDGMRNTQNLLNQAATFMTQLADRVEAEDQAISQKIRV